MVALHLEHVGDVELKRRLVPGHDEQIGVAVGVDAQQGADTVLVFFVQLEAVATDDLVVDAGFLHLEAGGVDDQVHLVLLAVGDRAQFGDLGDALAVGVHQMDIGLVERGQEFVVEGGPLAHEHVPGLEGFRRLLVLDDFIDAAVQPHDVVDIGVFLTADFLLGRDLGAHGRFGCVRVGAIDGALAARGLPARFQLACPVGIGGPVVADVDA